ncbi:phosphoribosyltransferase family protein [Zeaxanthinibacter sp. PT1]|uniref:phosphoribosyltransferase n=1 Tax=Zeaxanthinibacter TaxID=561554 RepID=UPI00234B2626|nr:phosphoribosyltransferase family protein [Zeaxanthinibacter sp. PT1]MDC6352104.1 phosphoribosyltransferase family protein [Zeaxanthinibacter sp. PT1]
MFQDRTDAALQLTSQLDEYRQHAVVVLAIPRGGLPLGAIIAKYLDAPLDVALSKKIGHPLNKEYAIGAISLEEAILSDKHGISEQYIEAETKRIREKLRQQQEQYYRDKAVKDLENKIVIIVDDGIATGNTIKVTAEFVQKKHPKMVIVAIPVAPADAVASLEASPHIDKVVCLHAAKNFRAVGLFYRDFRQVSDDEAIRILRENEFHK